MKKVVIVSGVGRGIGLAIARRLISEGYLVAGVDMDESSGTDLVSEFGEDSFSFHRADISEEQDVQGVFESVSATCKQVYGLVNNAGIIRDNMIWNMPLADFDKVIAVNLRGTWLMCREAARLMKAQGAGRIVNIASRAWLGNKGQSNYSPSKAGVVALGRVLALELGKYNVLVNTVAPGLIDTPLTRGLKKETLDALIAAQPTKAAGKPEDVAAAVAFLLAEQTGFVTGQTIYVDGGKSIGAGV